jgi:hypothetical protein
MVTLRLAPDDVAKYKSLGKGYTGILADVLRYAANHPEISFSPPKILQTVIVQLNIRFFQRPICMPLKIRNQQPRAKKSRRCFTAAAINTNNEIKRPFGYSARALSKLFNAWDAAS